MNKKVIFKLVIAVWLVLWIVFLAREDKDGQYKMIKYVFTHGEDDRVRYILGDDLYGFIVFAGENMPGGTTYKIEGFEQFSIDEVRLRYYLWPLKCVDNEADFIVYFGSADKKEPGYKLFREYKNIGKLYIKEK